MQNCTSKRAPEARLAGTYERDSRIPTASTHTMPALCEPAGLPPVQYKAYLPEYRDEYREPVVRDAAHDADVVHA